MKYEHRWILCITTLAAIVCSTIDLPVSRACCSLGPAKFSSTYIYAGEAMKDGEPVHVLVYQNAAQNLPPYPGAPTGNAMLLPIPAVPNSLTPQNVVDTRNAPHILFDMELALIPPPPKDEKITRSVNFTTPKFVVFDYDIYTIVLAQDAAAIPEALKQVKAEKRPAINEEIFQSYAKWYPNWTFALCCFNNKDMKTSKPLMWWYKPQDPSRLFFPALDAHNGKSPDLKESVLVDHVLLASCNDIRERAHSVHYRDPMTPDLLQLLPQKVIGSDLYGTLPNGDFYVAVETVRNGGYLNLSRYLPPGSGKDDPNLGEVFSLIKRQQRPLVLPYVPPVPQNQFKTAPVLKKQTSAPNKTPAQKHSTK